MSIPFRSVALDLVAGTIAIVLVVGAGIAAGVPGFDLRFTFGVSGIAFFCAGLIRGKSPPERLWIKTLLVGAGGLFLGTGAMIVNQGLHRLSVVIALDLYCMLLTAAAIVIRRSWHSARRRSMMLLAASGMVTALVLALVPALSAYSGVERKNYPVPAFTLTSFDGRTISSQEFPGHVVVLAFWASWCLPCGGELPEVEKVQRHFQNNDQVMVLAVDTGWQGESIEKGRRFILQRKLSLPTAFDSGDASRNLGVDALPTVVLIDRQGRVRMTHSGYDASEHLDSLLSAQINALLSE